MNLHSSWLAAGLLLFALLACNLSKNTNNSNDSNKNTNANKSTPQPTRAANADVYVDRVFMAKDKGGQAGVETSTYDASEHTVHCIAELNKAKKGTEIRFVWKTIDVVGEARDKDFRTTDYSTKSFENKIHGHLTRESDWPKGTYRVEIFINGA